MDDKRTDWDEATVTRKIGLLLKKAESTDSPFEAESLYALAQDLMTRYAIHEEKVRSDARTAAGRPVEEPSVGDWMFATYAHHATAKQDLLIVVAKHNWVRVRTYDNRKNANHYRGEANLSPAGTQYHESQWINLIGYDSDVAHTKMMYTSLLIQATKFANEDWRVRYGNAKHSDWSDGHMGKFAWISAHMEGFAERIGQRLQETRVSVIDSIEGAGALVINKEANIQEWMYEKGLAVRPRKPTYYCWTYEPEENRPLNKDGRTKSKKWQPKACILQVELADDGRTRIPHEGPHAFTYTPLKVRYSSYTPKGRETSYEGRSAGREAADRADIGSQRPRVGN